MDILYPRNANGEPLCLAYHTVLQCFNICGRKGDHTGRNHNTEEYWAVVEFLKKLVAVAPLN